MSEQRPFLPPNVHPLVAMLDIDRPGPVVAIIENIRASLADVGLTFQDLARALPPPATDAEILAHNFRRHRRGLADTRDLCPIEMIVRLQREAVLSAVEAVFVRRLARRLRGSKPLSLNQVELLRDLYREQFA